MTPKASALVQAVRQNLHKLAKSSGFSMKCDHATRRCGGGGGHLNLFMNGNWVVESRKRIICMHLNALLSHLIGHLMAFKHKKAFRSFFCARRFAARRELFFCNAKFTNENVDCWKCRSSAWICAIGHKNGFWRIRLINFMVIASESALIETRDYKSRWWRSPNGAGQRRAARSFMLFI